LSLLTTLCFFLVFFLLVSDFLSNILSIIYGPRIFFCFPLVTDKQVFLTNDLCCR
jgi:hypothetical protein